MRKLAIVLASSAALLLAAQGASADRYVIHIRLSKTDVTTEQFHSDRENRMAEASSTQWGGLVMWQWVSHSFDARKFLACMQARGYKPEADGRFEAKLRA